MSLLSRPAWLVGILADVGGFACQFLALAHGSLVLVQPLLVSGLLFALPVSAALSHQRPSGRELMAAGAVVGGLALFLVVASPGPGRADAPALTWALSALATAGVAGLIIAMAATREDRSRRAVLLAVAGGVLTGYAGALTKATAHLLGSGAVATLTSWQPYALAAFGVAALLVVQHAFQAGPLRWSLPALTVAETVVGIVIGAVVLDESIRSSAGLVVGEVAGIAVLTAGVFALGRSALVAGPDPGPRSSDGETAPARASGT